MPKLKLNKNRSRKAKNVIRTFNLKDKENNNKLFATLQCRPLIPEVNIPLKLAAANMKPIIEDKDDDITEEQLEKIDDRQLHLMAKYVVVGWDENTVTDDDGTPIPYNYDNCKEWIESLDPDFRDQIAKAVSNPKNFLADNMDKYTEKEVKEHEADKKELVKKSQSEPSGSSE